VKPLQLTDSQLDQIFRSAQPLAPPDRSKFSYDVATALNGCEVGDGLVLRTCREIQRKYFSAPDLPHGGKYD
jgi:hypothetical protein